MKILQNDKSVLHFVFSELHNVEISDSYAQQHEPALGTSNCKVEGFISLPSKPLLDWSEFAMLRHHHGIQAQ